MDRVRVSRACDRCKRRKIRCTGTQPCETCFHAASTECSYSAPYTRGRHPPIARPRQLGSPRDGWRRAPPAALRDHESSTQQAADSLSKPGLNSHAAVPESSSRASPELTETELDGHYVGPASGVSFLLRIQKRMHHTVSSFTFGDAPLPAFEPTFCLMLSKEDTFELLQTYFDFTAPVDRFMHQPTLEKWLDEFHETMGAMVDDGAAPARRAILWLIFALAQEHMTRESAAANTAKSIQYFLAADYQLSKEQSIVNLTIVQARLFQCLWLLSRSRINHCWSLFGITARLGLAIGLHRNRLSQPGHGLNMVELECRRRTFWNAYCLDNYLSIALGRPKILHDDDIDQEMPSTLDDTEIQHDLLASHPKRGKSAMLGPVAYFKLSRIVSMILRDLYSIRPPSPSHRRSLTAKYSRCLQDWRSGLPKFLDAGQADAAILMPIFRRQRNVLNLAYWHTIILLNRHFLLSNFTHVDKDKRESPRKLQTEEGVKECLQAAMSIVDCANDLIQSGEMFQSFWFTLYFSFSAVVVLYVYVIQQTGPSETSASCLDAATRYQSQMSEMAEPGTLPSRYCLVLEELRLEAVENSRRMAAQPTTSKEISATAVTGENQGVPAAPNDKDTSAALVPTYGNEDPLDFDLSPQSDVADIASWIDFESMIFPNAECFDPALAMRS